MHATDPTDPLLDQTLAEEIALLGEVVAAAGVAKGVMSDSDVDEALGLPTEPEEGKSQFHEGGSGDAMGASERRATAGFADV